MPSQPLFLPSLRHAILTGRPLVAVETATGELLAAVVEAARAAGREADLRIVLTPEVLREETEIAGTTRMDPDWPDDTLPAPVLRADEIDPSRSILVAAGMAEHAHPLGGRLAARMARLAAERGLPAPATLVHDSGETLDEAGQRALYGGHAPVELGYVDLYAPVDVAASFLAVPPIAGEAFAWAVARLETGAEVVEVDGCMACHGDGRLVVARRLALPTYHEHPARATSRVIEFREVGPNGWIRGVTCMEYGCDAAKLALAIRLAWRGGLRALRLAEHERHGIVPRTTPLQESGTCLVPDGKAALPPGMMGMISRYTDPALVAAIQGACHEAMGVAVFARVNADPAARQARRDFAMTYPALSRLLLRPDILACVDAGRARPSGGLP